MKHLTKIKIFNIPEGLSSFSPVFSPGCLKLTVWLFLFNVMRWSLIYIYFFDIYMFFWYIYVFQYIYIVLHKIITSRDFISNELSLLLYFTWKNFSRKQSTHLRKEKILLVSSEPHHLCHYSHKKKHLQFLIF